MPPKFGLATQEWTLEDSDSEEITPDPPRDQQAVAGRRPVVSPRVGRGESIVAEQDHDNHEIIDPEPSPHVSPSRPPHSYWSRWDLWTYGGLLMVAFAVILGVPRVGEPSSRGSTSRSASLPPKNILQTPTMTLAKCDIGALNLSCQSSQRPIYDVIPSLQALDLTSSEKSSEIEALGFHLGTLLHPMKIAIREEECFYFPQLQLDIHRAWEWTRTIQDSLKVDLNPIRQARSRIAQSCLDAEERLRSVDDAADGAILKLGSRHDHRETAYRENQSWLDVLEDCRSKLESRDAAWDWELGRQTRLEKDLRVVEERIQGLRIGTGQSDSANSSCTALNMQRVERQLLNTMMRAAEDDATATSLGTYYDAL